MARPARLPGAHASTAFSISLADRSPILLALEAAGAEILPLAVQDIQNRLASITTPFFDARCEAANFSQFHATVRAFTEALEDFRKALPSSYSPLANALVDRWKKSEGLLYPFIDVNGAWAFRFPELGAFESFRASMGQLALVVRALHLEERIGERGKPEYREDHALVRGLAELYSSITGKPPTRGSKSVRAGGRATGQKRPNNSIERTGGLFGNFVKQVDAELNRQLIACLTEQRIDTSPDDVPSYAAKFRLRGMDSIITAVVGKKSQKRR